MSTITWYNCKECGEASLYNTEFNQPCLCEDCQDIQDELDKEEDVAYERRMQKLIDQEGKEIKCQQ